MIDYQETNSFFAYGRYHFGAASIPAQLSGSYRSHAQDPVKIVVWSDHEDAPNIFDESMGFPYSVWFEGKTEMDNPVWMMGIKPRLVTGLNRLEGDVDIYIEGDLDASPEPGGQIFIKAIISPSPLIIPEWSYLPRNDGTLTRFRSEEERLGIRWENENGNFTLIDNYEFMNLEKENPGITIRLRTNSLLLTLPNTISSLKAVLFDLNRFLHNDLQLLSFIGRRRVVCYEATAQIRGEGKTYSTFSRYRSWHGFYNLPSEMNSLRSIIKPISLRGGIYNKLQASYNASPYQTIINRSIPYLLASYEDGYLESHLVEAYAALECMVDGIGEHLKYSDILGNNPFKKLSSKIKDLIHSEVTDPLLAEAIIKKLPELERRSFSDRLTYLLERFEIDTDLLWPPNTDQPEEFHAIIKRRNSLIHTGVLGAGDVGLFDLNRVQKLVELWILKLLGCPRELINEYSLWHDAPINEYLHF